MSLNLVTVFCMLVAGVVTIATTPATAMEPWEAAETIRRDTAKIERLAYLPDNETNRALLKALLDNAQSVFTSTLETSFPSAKSKRITADFNGLQKALLERSIPGIARHRNQIWTGILGGAYQLVLNGFEQGDLQQVKRWLAIREYALASRDTAASEAMDAALAGKMKPRRARDIINGELLRIYAGELRRSLASARIAAQKKYEARTNGEIARAQGLATLLTGNLEKRLGSAHASDLGAELTALAGFAARNDFAQIPQGISRSEKILLGYSPVALSPEEIERNARLLARFLKLVYIEYKDGVRDGRITVHIEYEEARLFRNRAQMMLGDLQGEMIKAAPDNFTSLAAMLREMRDIIEKKGPKKRIRELSGQSAALVIKTFNIKEDEGGHKVAFQMLPAILDEIVLLVGQGDYPGAEMKRLEAYSFFDPDIEQRLVPRSPTLSLKLESRFWEGSASNPGLGRLLETKGSPDALKAAVSETKTMLGEAQVILDAKLGSAGAFMQSLAIILREGLEAILIIAALIGTLRALGTTGYSIYIWGGVGLALVASFALWFAAGKLISISTANRELLEGATALLAAGVLIYVTHWIFHKTVVTDWISFVKEKVQETATSGRLMTLGVLSFFVVFREGFETVLFYEALMIDASPAPVLGGFAAGVVGTAIIAVALIYYGLRLPLGLFFKLTGFLLMILTIIFVGVGIRGLQTAGMVSATPVPGFPESPFLQLYLGIFPVYEPLLAQGFVIALFIVGGLWLRQSAKNASAVRARKSTA